jgi:lysophospholipase L1-like esterase
MGTKRAAAAGLWAAMLLGSVAFSLAAAELIARQVFELTPPIQVGRGDTRLSPEENAVGFVGDPELIWRLRRNVRLPDRDAALRGLVSNDQGLREPATIPAEKAPNELRILFLGESITFGWQVRHDETFADRTEQALRERFPGVEIVTINAGVPGHSLFQGWRFLVTEGFAYRPDLVVLGSFGFNDSGIWRNLSDFEQHARWQARQPPAWLRWSALAQLIADRLQPAPKAAIGDKPRPRLRPTEFRELLERIEAATRAHGAELLIVVPGHEYNLDGHYPKGTWGPYQTVLARYGAGLHLGPLPEPAVVDGAALLQQLEATHERSELMFDYVHPTPLVHAALAEQLADRISPWVEAKLRFGELSTSGAR